MINADLILSPEGHVYLDQSAQALEQIPKLIFTKLSEGFTRSFSYGLLQLALGQFSELPSSFSFWQNFGQRLITEVCKLPNLMELKALPEIALPPVAVLQEIINDAPFVRGFEYLNLEVLSNIWKTLQSTLQAELKDFEGSIQDYFSLYNSRWNLVGRVCFHLAENKNNPDRPFAFVATYTTKLNEGGAAQHLPLKRALQEYAGEKKQAQLLALLLPVQKAAEKSPFIKQLVDNGHIFQALTWNVKEAHQFLTSIPLIEAAGVMIRVPNWWNAQKPVRAKVAVSIGQKPASIMGLDTLLDFDVALSLSNGEHLSKAEWQELMNSSEHLVKVKGQWVEVDHEKLQSVLAHWNQIKDFAAEGISLSESMKLLAGTKSQDKQNLAFEANVEWSNVTAGDWLKSVLSDLRNPDQLKTKMHEHILAQHLNATLRPYQLAGVNWLWLLYQLKLGGCLADDMGLGKTIQILAFLLLRKYQPGVKQKPHLLIVPASLIGNWQAEIAKFAPSLSYLILHGSIDREALLPENKDGVLGVDLVMTTYAFAHRLSWLKTIDWDVIILDEAQTIKNPSAKQTQAIKALSGKVRFTLTGTPIENRLSDLWSLFDFTSPGLLGSGATFSSYEKKANKAFDINAHQHFMGAIRTLTAPYILRRLKTDKKIISDLPDKTEIQTFCNLTKQQVQLYEQSVRELKKQLHEVEGMKRRGLVLAYLLRFKQICNHPSQWLGYGDYDAVASGKLLRLKEICAAIAAKQEKVLVFTQFTEMIPALVQTLSDVFGQKGLSLDGKTLVKKRGELVNAFQAEQGPPFFVLSLKAGGTGLTLTRASHVIHFDRWWNPAVENQATDRAYRIGQKHPVMVHKFICRGTVEEKIDALIMSKKKLSAEILQSGNELAFTELSNDELLDMISLDIHKALG